jgi:hypothetical protein
MSLQILKPSLLLIFEFLLLYLICFQRRKEADPKSHNMNKLLLLFCLIGTLNVVSQTNPHCRLNVKKRSISVKKRVILGLNWDKKR